MKKYSISFGFSITVGRVDRPDNQEKTQNDSAKAPAKPIFPDPADSFLQEDDDGWVTPPEIKAVFDKRLADANQETS